MHVLATIPLLIAVLVILGAAVSLLYHDLKTPPHDQSGKE